MLLPSAPPAVDHSFFTESPAASFSAPIASPPSRLTSSHLVTEADASVGFPRLGGVGRPGVGIHARPAGQKHHHRDGLQPIPVHGAVLENPNPSERTSLHARPAHAALPSWDVIRPDADPGKPPCDTTQWPEPPQARHNTATRRTPREATHVSTGIGARVPRKEDARHLAGKAQFVGDLSFPRLWEVAFVRSPLAHARIRSVTVPERYAGRVFTAGDMEGVRPIRAESSLPSYKSSDYPPLARGKVRFAGECVALCIAPTRAEAEDVAEAVVLDLEALPAVIDSLAARRPGAPRVHDEWDDNLFLTTSIDGDVESVRMRAAVVIKREYRTARQCMVPLEGKAVLARHDERKGQLVVYTSTQVPHLIRTGLSQFLGLDQADVRVIAPDVGGGFGYKCVLQPEEISVSWAAMHTGRPLRWVEDRREHLTAGANTRQHHYRLTACADERGRLLAIDAEITVDVGAYSVWPFTACLEAAQAGGNLPGPYALDVYRCKTWSVATNKPGFTPYRGVARPGVCFAMELTIDAIARAVGREPADVRAENLVPAGAMPYTNVTGKFYDSGDYPGSVAGARRMIDLEAVRARQSAPEPDGRRIGIGFSTFTEQTAHGTKVFGAWGLPLVPGYEQAMVKLAPSGAVEVRSGNQSFGQGLETTLAQIASEQLGIDVDRIKVTMGDTGETPYSTGAYASRGMVMAGGAVSKAGGVPRGSYPQACGAPPPGHHRPGFALGRTGMGRRGERVVRGHRTCVVFAVPTNFPTTSTPGGSKSPKATSPRWTPASSPTRPMPRWSQWIRPPARSRSSTTCCSRTAGGA